MVSKVGKNLQRVNGFQDGDGVRDSSVYLDGHTAVVDVRGRDAGSAAFLVRGLSAANAPTEVFRVDKNGAVGYTGAPVVAANYATLQLAADAAVALGPGAVLQLTGDHAVSASLNLDAADGLTIRGPASSRIVPAVGATAAITADGCSGLTLEGFTIDASAAGSAAAGVALYNATNCRVRGLTITGVDQRMSPSGMAVLLSACTDCVVEGCDCYGNGAGNVNGQFSLDILLDADCIRCDVVGCHCTSSQVQAHIGVQNSAYCRVVGNTCTGAITEATSGLPHSGFGYGIYLYSNVGGNPVDNCIVAGNVVYHTEGDGCYLQRCQYCAVTGNVFQDTCINVTGGGLAEGAIAANSESLDVLIANNVIDTCPAPGIRFDGARFTVADNQIRSVTVQGISVAGVADGSVITGNVISACGGGIVTHSSGLGITGLVVSHNTVTTTTGQTSGIALDDVDYLVCVGNLLRACGGYGISLSACTEGEIGSNTCQACNGSNNGYDGINLNGACTGINVHHNYSGGGNQAYGIRLAGSGHACTDNQCRSNVTGGIINGATAATRRGNRFSTGALQGTATLVGGTVTVSTIEVRSGDSILVTRLTSGGTAGHLSAPPGSITAATSLVINSSSGTDTSVVFWEILH